MMSNGPKQLCGGVLYLVLLCGMPAYGVEPMAERAINCDTVVAAPRHQVWETLTTTEGVTTFFAPNAHVELRYGGPYEIYFVPDAPYGSRGSEGCRVISYVPSEVLSFTWNAPPMFVEMRGKRTFVVIRLSDADEGQTRVQLTNGGYGHGEKWDQVYEYFTRAWPRVLGNLQKRFETGPLTSEGERNRIKPNETKAYAYFIAPARPEMVDSPTAEESAAVEAHWQYLLGLLAQNKLVLAGRTQEQAQLPSMAAGMVPLEMSGFRVLGIVVFEAESDAEAKQIMESDPAVQRGVFKARVHPYGVALLRP